jgi:GT2 family glycosyltransferase
MSKTSFIFLNYGPPNILENAIVSFISKHTTRITNIQLVIVDNFTTEKNCLAVRLIKNRYTSLPIHLIFSANNIGYGAGNNLGLKYAFETLNSDLAIVLNTDIVFEKISEKIISQPVLSKPMLYTFNVIENTDNISFNEFSRFTFTSKPSNMQKKNSYPSGCCWGMNRHMWEVSKGFVENHFLYFEELEFIHRYKNKFKNYPTLTKIEDFTILHSQGGTTGISRDVRSRSLISEFWSARSRIVFAKNCIFLFMPAAIFYNALLVAHRLIKRSPNHAKTVLAGTFSALLNKPQVNFCNNTVLIEPAGTDLESS